MERRQGERVDRTKQLGTLLLQSKSVRNGHQELRDRLGAMQKSVHDLRGSFSTKQPERAFLKEVHRVAESTELQISDYQVGLKKSLPTHSQTEVQFRCNGSYASVCQFLEQIKHLTKTTKLSRFRLDAETNLEVYPIQLTFVLYSEAQSHDTKEKRGVL